MEGGTDKTDKLRKTLSEPLGDYFLKGCEMKGKLPRVIFRTFFFGLGA